MTDQEEKKLKRELRETKKYLKELSAVVSLTLHYIDTRFTKDQTVPRKASGDLAKIANLLDLNNDIVRRYALDLSITEEGKERFIKKLLSK